MSYDANRLLACFQSGSLVRPDASQPGVVDLARALATLAGAKRYERETGVTDMARGLGGAEHYVFVLLDGMGMEKTQSLSKRGFFQKNLKAGLRTVFPSTTAAVLGSLTTCEWPAAHGVLAWYLYLPFEKISLRPILFNERFTETPLEKFGISPAAVFPLPSAMFHDKERTLALQPEKMGASVFSRWLHGYRPAGSYTSLESIPEQVAGILGSPGAPFLLYIYVPDLDSVCHEKGVQSAQAGDCLARLEKLMERLNKEIKGRARLVVTADHGLKDVPEGRLKILGIQDPLQDFLRVPPTGEGRVPFFHLKDGRGEEFERAFRDRFGASFALLTASEAEEMRLFGPRPLSPASRERVGDYIGISLDDSVLETEKVGKTEPPLKGFHGGLSKEEMMVPLIVA